MKNVVLLLGQKDWEEECFTSIHKKYQICYEYLYSLALKHSVRLSRASYEWYNTTSQEFVHAWTYDGKTWKRISNVKPDLIYDKTKRTAEAFFFKQTHLLHIPTINDVDFSDLLDNKLYTNLLFPEFTKTYYKVLQKRNLPQILSQIKSDKVVIKSFYGSGGDDVLIAHKQDINSSRLPYPLLIQEFIDSSNGIPGIIDNSVHDFRIVCIENEIMYSYLRIPKENSFIANLSKGGRMMLIKNDQIPESTKPILNAIQKKFSVFKNKIYTIDIMFDKKQIPWVIELNGMPGLYFSEDQKDDMGRVFLRLVTLFKDACM